MTVLLPVAGVPAKINFKGSSEVLVTSIFSNSFLRDRRLLIQQLVIGGLLTVLPSANSRHALALLMQRPSETRPSDFLDVSPSLVFYSECPSPSLLTLRPSIVKGAGRGPRRNESRGEFANAMPARWRLTNQGFGEFL
ncbi:Protein of unknown function [Gryllus bimaculatus]|nr:Protein of unknown function [Gryllus bimaculatus]